MFYGSSASMSLPSKSKLKRQSRTFTQVLYRTLSHRDRRSVTELPEQVADDPAELSTQTSAPGVLKVFGDEICTGANYKSVLATPCSSARELVKEALERYSLNKGSADNYVLCDVIGKFEGQEKRWRTECLRALGDSEKPLLLQDLWKPKEGFSRRFELRRRAEVEEMAAKEKDTVTADINAQARKLQRNRAKGTMTLNPGPKRYYSTLDGLPAGRRKEEREPGGVRHSLYQSPHLLLLQGYNRQDCLVYLLNRDQHTVGQETASARPNICLSSPDILPLHCKIRKVQVLRRSGLTEERLVVEPVPHASVLVNFSRAEHSTPLRHGDLLSFGAHYVFLYKDPVSARPLPAQTLARLRALNQLYEAEDGRRRLHLDFEQAHEDELIGRIMCLIEPGGDDHKLTPAYLLCLCIKHSATAFEPGSFGKLLLKIVKRIQSIAWEKTKELAQKQAQHQDPTSLSLLNISDLVPDLQVIIFWMSNAIEILYFIQQKSPTYMQGIEQLDSKGSKESLLSATISANEEAMTTLEEVIMYTFQQCVYYITKSLYVALPGMLDCNPFQGENNDGCWRRSAPPEPVRKVLQVFQTTQDLLHQYEVHPEIQSQMFAYLFFFSNVSLFNQLLDKGESSQSGVIQIQACLRMVLDWAGKMGLTHLADKFLAKFCSAVSILATPPQQLMQSSWKSLSMEYPTLKPVQLHRILSQYQLASGTGPVTAWQPSVEEETHIYRTVDLLESFENHPPIVLPSSGFKVDLESDAVDENVYRQLLYVRHFLWGLKTKSPSRDPPQPHCSPRPATSRGDGDADGGGSVAPGAEERLCEKLQQVQMQTHHSLRRNGGQRQGMQPLDSSCLLTPPNTPLYPDNGLPEHVQVNGGSRSPPNGFVATGLEGDKGGLHFPFPVSSSHGSAADHFYCVFVVELDKGPFGLGMGLIDGLHTPLNSPGIYIRTLIPEGPAASDGRLRVGDRILAVNGTSLIGADYQSAVDLIRLGGGRLRFLLAKSDQEVSEKISASSC
uniref:Ras association and DIL domains n=1 Tax=Scleropages formosus TaxID=113540 RepID=A0A8C9VB11_SCLFO